MVPSLTLLFRRATCPIHTSPKCKVSFLHWEAPVLRLCPWVSRAWGRLEPPLCPLFLLRLWGSVASSFGPLLVPATQPALHTQCLIPSHLPNGRWPATPLSACEVGPGVVTENSGPVPAVSWARAGKSSLPPAQALFSWEAPLCAGSPPVRQAAWRCVLAGMARGHLPGLSLLPSSSHLANSCGRSILSQGSGGTGSSSRGTPSSFEVALGWGSQQP